MNPKITLILIILLIALGGYVYFFELADSEEAANSTTLHIFKTPYGEFDIIELAVGGTPGTARFARTNEALTQDWEMLSPIAISPTQLDQSRVNGAATRLGRLTASQVITDATDLAQYGLDPPELTVTLTISNGQKVTLYTGDKTPVTDSRYLRLETENQSVYLVFTFVVDDLYRLLEEPPFKPTPLPTLMPSSTP